MNNQIYEITENFNFENFKMENPSLINGNNYFSKIYNNNPNKNFYIQLPKCRTKQGIVNSNTKCFCELEFNSNDKIVIEFFENLENYCAKQICNNKELWFYDSDNISNDDIYEYITPIMRSYKSGKKFLIKTNIKQDKIIIYDENEKKINLEDYNNNEIIPLLCINGVKFSKSSFIVDIILVQFMILYPSDNFENQILIKINKQNDLEKNKQNDLEKNKQNDLEKNKQIETNLTNLETTENNNSEFIIEEVVNNKTIENKKEKEENNEENNEENKENIEENNEHIEENNEHIEENNEENIEDKKEKEEFKYLMNNLETTNNSNDDNIIELSNLDNLIENNNPIELKTHETIYLEIYKKAKQKAKEIRKNAIEAFLEAKHIKTKYNLNNIIHDSSSDDENEFITN